MNNSDHHFWPGQFVDVKLVLTTEKGAVLIPTQATQISQQGPFVYIVKPDDTAELRVIKLGQRQGDQVVVTDGVAPNERVVLMGQLLIRPGGKVRVDAGAPPSNVNGNTKAPGGKS
jgi:multidrug efflux system membrane fusion protein